MRNVVIIGSGCAGLTAAVYAARANLQPLVVRGAHAGGQLTLTTLVENFPGFPKGVQGPELIELMQKQATEFGAEFLEGNVTKVDLSRRPFVLEVHQERLETSTLIIASGASAKLLGLESERKLLGHGVSTCATCDGYFFRGKEVAVVGGGDTAAEDALFLTRYAKEVSIIHRREQLRASKIMQDRLHRNEKIKFIWNSEVEDILDADKREVSGIKLRNIKTEEGSPEASGRGLYRDRARAQHQLVPRAIGGGRPWVSHHPRRFENQHPGGFCRRRRQRPRLPASHNGGGFGLHGRDGRRKILGSGALN